MLAFDLETTGVSFLTDRIICAAACDPCQGLERTFVFPLGDAPEDFMRLLDGADRLCSFNGARFDIPFMVVQWGVPAARAHGWRVKLHDVFEACRSAFRCTFKLQDLLAHNGLPGKSGTGAEAVGLAERGEWERLREYCLTDTLRTHAVSSLDPILLPRLPGIALAPDGRFRLVRAGP